MFCECCRGDCGCVFDGFSYVDFLVRWFGLVCWLLYSLRLCTLVLFGDLLCF